LLDVEEYTKASNQLPQRVEHSDPYFQGAASTIQSVES